MPVRFYLRQIVFLLDLPAYNGQESPTHSPVMKLLKRRSTKGKKRESSSLTSLEKLTQQFPDALRWQLKIMEVVLPFTMTSPERVFALINAVVYVCEKNIPGDFVECGVWKGGSSAAIAQTLVHLDVRDRKLWMYDTFDGMSQPTDSDVDFQGQTADRLLEQQDIAESTSVWCRSPLEEVKITMQATHYPMERIEFVQGRVEDTLPQRSPQQVALLRLDTDWYESTKCELEFLFPRMNPGSVLIVDDYGHWQGCRKAVDEYFDQHGVSMLLNRIDYTGRIGVFCPSQNRHA